MNDRAATGWLAREIDGRALLARAQARWLPILLGLGAIFRVVEYLRGRLPWMDESTLSVGIVGHPFWEPPRELRFEQLAPYGFLVAERLVAGLFGSSVFALRLFPLTVGVVSLILFARIRPVVGVRSTVVAVGLFACSDSLIYFSSEIKPYIVDVLAAVICLLLPNADDLRSARPRRLLAISAIGSAIVWFSFPSAFCLAGVGLGWVLAGRRDGKTLGRAALVSAPWLINFLCARAAATILLAPRSSMWVFWGFAFPPRDPAEAVVWVGRRLLNLFANPLHFDSPIGARWSAVLGATFAAWGVLAVARADRERLTRLLAPILVALVVSGFRLMPFHGRLLLFAVPLLTWLIAEGVADLGDRLGGGRRADWLVIAVLFTPFLVALFRLIEPTHWFHLGQGDLRPNPWL